MLVRCPNGAIRLAQANTRFDKVPDQVDEKTGPGVVPLDVLHPHDEILENDRLGC